MKSFDFCGFSALRCCAVAAAFGLGCAGPTTIVQSALPQGISVSGHGEARGQPDIARVTLGVETRSASADEATTSASQQMTGVINALQQKGVAPADIRTQNFSVNFEQQPEPYPPPPPASVGRAAPDQKPGAEAAPSLPRGFYRVNNTVIVTVRNTSELGALLGAATAAGANTVWGIQFEIEDPSKLEEQARAEAMKRARQRAEQLAALAGVKLGRMISAGESGGGGPVMREGYGYSMKAAQMDVPVQSGELTVSQDVQVVYAIE